MTRQTLKSLDEIGAALDHAERVKMTEAETRDPLADEEQELRAGRAAKPRILVNPASNTTERLLAEAEEQEQEIVDIDDVANLLTPIAEHFGHEIEGAFSERMLAGLARFGDDRAAYLKDKRIPEILDEMKALRTGTGEIDANRLDAKLRFLDRLERERALWIVFAKGAKKGFKDFTGTEYREQARGRAVPRVDAAAAQLDAVMKRYGRTA